MKIHERAARCDQCLTASNPGVSSEQALEILAAHFAATQLTDESRPAERRQETNHE